MGVDVGGKRKAFDVALVEDRRLVGLRRRQSVGDVAAWVASAEPGVVAIDTASWTRWHGPRNGRPRSVWTRAALAALELSGVPPRTNQDSRDAIAAAWTARAYDQGHIQRFGDIVVPRSPAKRR
jgi:predicted nuclease with RNAse H fold